MDTESLRLFVLAAEKLNISAAGRELGMVPAVASARLAKLEKSMGADLLHRSTRKVSVSLEGSELLPFAREIIAQEDAARAALGQKSLDITGTIRFTAPSTFAQNYVAPVLPEFTERHPKIRLDLRLSDARYDLIDGSFDLAIRNAELEDTSLKGRKLARDVRILCASPEYLAANGMPERPEDLNAHRLIAFKDGQARPLIGPDGQTGLFDPQKGRCQIISDDGMTQKVATLAGAGISINSLWNVHEELADGRLIRVLPGFAYDADTALWLVYPKTNILSPKVRVFMDFLLEKIGSCAVFRDAR
ncbi:LysR family transcriptional regulator [Pacificoceanicola onchidii]|uniref:LysR family transcriptional regulator n=1 Tax=Pacificoceanicola onchidii TaxID=2562685 RepID=UPI0010A67D3B|nr:LysR family transcriptional regulator [Pacificoceanicola onchidii]